MATRRERVIVEAVDDYTGELLKMAAATQTFRRALDDSSSGSSPKVRQLRSEIDQTGNAFTRASRSIESDSQRVGKEIDRLSGRLSIVRDAVLTLGPAAAPLGGVAVAGVAALANQAAFAGVALGTMMLASQGVGDALKAMNAAAVDPTAANLEKVRQTMAAIGPDAQRLVVQLHQMVPAFKGLRDAAAAGFLPGVSEALDSVSTLFPRWERLLQTVGDAAGDMLASGAESLTTDRWADFFNFLQAEARPTIEATARTAGDLAHGLTELWEAFAPLNRDSMSWIEDAAAGFDRWATSLSKTEGFKSFVEYVRETGPQVADTLGALANSGIQIVQAIAPLGGPSLRIIESVANMLSLVADSPAGPALLGAAAGFAALNRVMQVQQRLRDSTAGGLLGAAGSGGLAGLRAEAEARIGALNRIQTASRGVAEAERALAAAQQQRAATAVRARDAQMAMIPTADKRAAVRDYTASVEAVGAAERRLGDAQRERAAAWRSTARAAAGAGVAVAAIGAISTGAADGLGLTNTATLGLAGSMAGPLGGALGATAGLLLDVKASADATSQSVTTAGEASARLAANLSANNLASASASLSQLREDVKNVMPTDERDWNMARNISGVWKQLTGEAAEMQAQQRAMETQVRNASIALWGQQRIMSGVSVAMRQFRDSTAGRELGVTDAIRGLGNAAMTTEQRANSLQAALDGLLSPQMNKQAATDQFRQGLNNLSEELAANSRTLRGNSNAAIQNRAALRSRVSELSGMLVAEAKAGASSQQMSDSLRRGRRDILDAAAAAGLNRDAVRRMIATYGLTPRMIRTLIRQYGAEDASDKTKRLIGNLKNVPKSVQSKLIATDPGTPVINRVKKNLTNVPKSVQSKLLATDPATGVINGVRGNLNNLDGNKAVVTIETRRTTVVSTVYTASGRRFKDVPSGVPEARGGVLDFYGSGGFREHHVAQIAPAGAWRVWAEEETGGEAYIPLANDWRRGRAIDIWEETGRRLGVEFRRYAMGDIRPPQFAQPSVSVGSPRVSVGGANVAVYLDGQQIRAIVRQEAGAVYSAQNAAQGRWDDVD